ncbi:MAG: phosphatidyl-myo-inositol dimannoside synthase [Actinomycetota bacterium]|nr:phosphatidyl-myo-inositol dimannoside synthase [Actinomycetota bacterium]
MAGRTLVVTNDFPPRVGGIESFVLAMVRRMPPDQVVVHTARQPRDAAFDATLAFPVVRDPAKLMLPTPQITRRSVQIARDLGCESVWFGAATPLGLMAKQLKARAGVRRTVATTHGHEVWWARTPGTQALLRRIGDSNDVLTYLGSYTRERIARALSAEAAARMVQLTPGVDDSAFHPGVDGTAVRERHGLGTRPVVVCVSRLVERKGQDMLIRSLPSIHRRVPDAAILIVGDGPQRGALERLVDELGLRNDVVFAGAKPWAETPPYFAAGDVFCMPTRTRKAGFEVEGLGIVYLEASACGLPVVAGDSGGAPDAVQEGVTGYVVDGRSPEAIAERVSGLLLDRELGRQMGEQGRRWVEKRWRWDDLAAQLQQLLRG